VVPIFEEKPVQQRFTSENSASENFLSSVNPNLDSSGKFQMVLNILLFFIFYFFLKR
jgi:hypothetical protein